MLFDGFDVLFNIVFALIFCSVFITSSTSYYVTFEVDSGDRIEFSMSGSEYGMLIEGDAGTLNFQGTRYLGFERK